MILNTVKWIATHYLEIFTAYLVVILPDFERDDYWWEDGFNLYLDNMAKHGFEQVEEPQIGDVILINIGADVPNHAAILCGQSNGTSSCAKTII